MYNDDRMKLQKEIIPKNTLFTINKNYNTTEVNKMMKSSKNIFTHISPLLTKTLTSFTNKSKGYNLKTIATNSIHNKKYLYFFRNKKSMNLPKPKSHTNYLKTHSNFQSIDNDFKSDVDAFQDLEIDLGLLKEKIPQDKIFWEA